MTDLVTPATGAPDTSAPDSSDPIPTPAELEQQLAQNDKGQGETDTPQEPVVETDEQKNARELAERQKRSERAQRGIQKRLDELTADKYAEREARQRAERMLEQLMTQGMPQRQQPGQQDPNAPPSPDDPRFNGNYEAYLEARAEWRAEQRTRQMFQQFVQSQQEQSRQQQVQSLTAELGQQFNRSASEYAKANPDFVEAVKNSEVEVTPEVLHMLQALPDGPAVAHHLAVNPDVASLLNQLPAPMQGLVVGSLAAQLKAQTSPQVSKAPRPGTPVGARAASSIPDPPHDPDAYMVWAEKYMKR